MRQASERKIKRKMKVQSHRGRGETGKGKENKRKMKVQSHRGTALYWQMPQNLKPRATQAGL